MTIIQLEYFIAIADTQSFSLAADRCFVTQPTLSMQIKKLEEELEVVLFDRNVSPVQLTELGKQLLPKARRIVQESKSLHEFVKDEKGIIKGDLTIGIIPTLAPYLLPLFIGKFMKKFPMVNIHITEFTTEEIIHRIKESQLDCGILASPLHEKGILEKPVFYERFVAYLSPQHPLLKKKVLDASDLDTDETWILHEGHCFRNQVMNFCKFRKSGQHARLHYESGSIQTLKKLVETEKGLTVMPELAIRDFSAREMKMLRYFRAPEPVREIAVVCSQYPVKEKMIDRLAEEIAHAVPEKWRKKEKNKVVDI